ncbi:MAG: FAD-binding protein, partial [Candidatus Binatia bacterium]
MASHHRKEIHVTAEELTRRSVLQFLGALSFAPALDARAAVRRRGGVLNDVHSGLNATRVADVVPLRSTADVVRALRRARAEGLAVSVAGGRHAMGGQQFGTGTLHLDTRPMSRILSLDTERGVVDVEAGIQWPELIEGCVRR